MMNWTKPGLQKSQVAVTVPNQAVLLADLRARLEAGQGFSVATLNLDHVVKLARDPAFRQAYAAQSHVTADGNPIVWLARLAGQADVELVTGSDLVGPMAALAAEIGTPVALIGATDDALRVAAEAMAARYPGLSIVLTLAPPMGFDPDGAAAGAAIETLRRSGARLVFLALGAPKQERFAARALAALPETGFLSIGASLDFIAGTQTRAPAWVRRLALEWVWRLLNNPKRLAGRYAACFAILPGLVLRALSIRRQQKVSPS